MKKDLGHDVAMALRAAYWAMHRRTDAALAKAGVTADQFVLLSLLEREVGGVTQRELVERASSDANTVRAMLVRLERLGLVARRPHPTDGRARSVTLTAKGRRSCGRLWRSSDAVRSVLTTALDGVDVGELVVQLRRISEAMAARKSVGGGPVLARRS